MLMAEEKATVIRKSTYLLSCLQRKEGANEELLCLRLREQLIRLAAILAFIYEMYSISAALRHLRVSDKMISIKGARTVAAVVHVSVRDVRCVCSAFHLIVYRWTTKPNILLCTHWQILLTDPSSPVYFFQRYD